MTQFLGYALPGIPYGCTYALIAVGLVLTYQATGVFNFAFGAQAYTSAVVFNLLTEDKGLPVWAAFLVSVVFLAPTLGFLFDRLLFRFIPNTNQTAKVVTGLSLFVALPNLIALLWPAPEFNTPSLLFNVNTVYFSVGGTPVNGGDLGAMILTAIVLVLVVALMRGTSLGLQMRAAVESRRLVQLDGVNAGGVVAVAWMVSSLLAGVAGVLFAPLFNQLQPESYANLMVAAIAAAAWAVLRSMPIAALVAVIIGVVEGIATGYLPSGGILYASVLPSLPFIVLAAALLLLPGLRTLEDAKDPLASVDPPTPPPTAMLRSPQTDRVIKIAWRILLVAFVVSMLTWIPVNWVFIFTSGITLSTIFLSITLITGMAGQLSLAQGTLAGVGAFTVAQLSLHLHLTLLLGMLVGAGLAAVVAAVLAVASLRLQGIGLSLLTIAAALFFDNTVFPLTGVSGGLTGVVVPRSRIGPINFEALSTRPFFVLAFIVLSICAGLVILVSRGTTGRFLGAIRGSQTAASGIGINLSRNKVLVFALAGAIAAIGGAMSASLLWPGQVSAPEYSYQFSLVYVVVVVTTGVSSVEGAIQAGMGFVIIQQLLGYLPPRIGAGNLTYLLFAFGAFTYAAHPEGILEYQKRRSTLWFDQHIFKRPMPPGSDSGQQPSSPGPAPVAAGGDRA